MGPFLIGVGIFLAGFFMLRKTAEGSETETGTATAIPAGTPVTIDTLIAEAARHYSVDAALVKAIAMTESSLNPNAVNPSDPSYGLCQIMPILAEDYGIVKDYHNPTEAEIAMIKDPETNLRICAWHMKHLMEKYTLEVSVEMYNVGESGWLQGRRNSAYVKKVLGYYTTYKGQ